MTGARELLCTREARGSRADHSDALSGCARRRLRNDPTLRPRVIDNVFFDQLDGNGIVVDVEDASLFARRGTHAPGALGKIIGRVKAVDRFAPASAINQIVPIGNNVAERATLVAEGDPAIHATRSLGAT